MPPRQLGLRMALIGLSSYTAGAAAVADSNQNIRQSALDAAQGGSALDAKTVALGVALGNLASGGIQMALGGLKKLATSLWGMAKEAGPVAGLKMSFDSLAEASGSSGPAMLAAMRQATGGMAPMKDMMTSFNQAAQLISLDFAKTMPEAMQYLGKVAYATGTNMDYLMNSLVVGVGRMSPMILDNLAIQVKLSDAVERATEMYGVHKDELTKTQQQMGMMNIVLEKLQQNTQHMPDVAGSATSAIQSLGAMLQDFRTELGIAVLPLLSEWTGVLTKLANMVLPRVIKGVQAIMGPLGEFTAQVGDAIDPLFRLADTALGAIGPAFTKMMQSLEPLRDQIGNWIKLIGVRLSSIVDLITGTVGPGVSSLADFFDRAFDRIGQALQRGGNLFLYLLRVVDDVMLGIRNSLQGKGEAAQKNFTEAWQTAIAVVITVLKNAVGAVVSWGKALVQSYASGIIQGIREFLAGALQAVAGFIRSWMSPGSPPKFLPDIGKWGAGAMNAWLGGMSEADYGLIAGVTGQVSQELSKMVEDGKMKAGDFGNAFGRIRAALVEVTDHFRKTGEIASEKLDILRDKLGKTGEALAELTEYQLQYTQATEALDGLRKEMQALEDQEYELDKALRPYLDALEELRAKEQDARDEAYELYEAGEIGAEEYEDRVKALQEERAAAERVVREQEKGQRAQRTAIRDQKRELTDQERIYQRQAEQLAEEIGLLEARLGFHQETLSVQDQQKQMAEAMAKAMESAAGAAKKAGDEAAAMVEELQEQAQGGGFLEGLFGGGEDRAEAPKMDFGELLPDVEETKQQVANFFDGLLERARQTVEEKLGEIRGQFETFLGQNEWAQKIVTFFTTKLPKFIRTAYGWLSKNLPKWKAQFRKFWGALPKYVERARRKIGKAIEKIRQFWEETLQPALQTTWDFIQDNLIPILSGLAATILVTLIPAYVAWALSAGTAAAAAISAAVSTVIAMAPLIAIAAAVGVAVALLVAAWQNDFMGMRTILTEFWEEKAKPIFEAVKEWLSVNIPLAIAAVSDWWENTLVPAIQVFVGFITEKVVPIFVSIREWLSEKVPEAIGIVKEWWQKLVDAVQAVGSFFTDTLFPIFQEVYDWIADTLKEAFETILGPISALWEFLDTSIFPIFESLSELFETVAGILGDVLWGAIENLLLPKLRDLWTFLTESFQGAWVALTEFWEETLMPAIDKIISIVETGLTVAIGGLLLGITAVYDYLVQFFTPGFEALHTFWVESLQPAIETITDWIGTKLLEAWTALTGGFDTSREKTLTPLEKALGYIQDKLKVVNDYIQTLIEKVNQFAKTRLPAWAQAKSPPPFAVGLDYISKAMKELSNIRIPALQAGLTGLTNATTRPGTATKEMMLPAPPTTTSTAVSNDNRSTTLNFQVQLASGMDAVGFQNQLAHLLNSRG